MHDLLSVDDQRSEQVQAYAITEASKVHFLRIPLAPPQKYHTFCMVFFLFIFCLCSIDIWRFLGVDFVFGEKYNLDIRR